MCYNKKYIHLFKSATATQKNQRTKNSKIRSDMKFYYPIATTFILLNEQ